MPGPKDQPSELNEEALNSAAGGTNDRDAMSEMGETGSLRLQQMMDRHAKMSSTLSNAMKKQSDTTAGITQNMK